MQTPQCLGLCFPNHSVLSPKMSMCDCTECCTALYVGFQKIPTSLDSNPLNVQSLHFFCSGVGTQDKCLHIKTQIVCNLYRIGVPYVCLTIVCKFHFGGYINSRKISLYRPGKVSYKGHLYFLAKVSWYLS